MVDFGFDLTRDDLVTVAARLAGAVLTAGLLAWSFRRALRGSARRRDFSDVQVLEYGPALRWLFALTGLGFGALYVAVARFDPAGIGDPAAKLLWPVVLIESLSLVGVLETWGVRIELSDHGISSRSPWTGSRRLAWGEVERVRFSESLQWFVVTGTGGTRVYLHVFLSGLGAFRDRLHERLSPNVYGPAEPYLRQLGVLAGWSSRA